MSRLLHIISLPVACLLLSLLVHSGCLMALSCFSGYQFGKPVPQPAVTVDLAQFGAPAGAVGPTAAASGEKPGRAALPAPAVAGEPAPRAVPDPPEAAPAPQKDAGDLARPDEGGADREASSAAPPAAGWPAASRQEALAPSPGAGVPPAVAAAPAPAPGQVVRLRGSDFLAAQQEKLSYRLSLHGIPVGTAELEARNDQGALLITLRVSSSPALSGIFPVDDLVETRHVDGRFIMTRIRQQEGSFKSDQLFTINLGKQRVSATNFIESRSLKLALPTDRVLDSLSGIYFLRNRPLQVGRNEILHIYDGEGYAEVPVEVLRREEMRLANLSRIATLVLHPLQQGTGIFRRTGDVLIWMSDDENRVPVKMVTSVPLGRVTADLVSAEATPSGESRQPVVSRLAAPPSD